jgi:hypothetical protein
VAPPGAELPSSPRFQFIVRFLRQRSGGRIGAFNERLICLIEKNLARSQDLQRRYGDL